MGLTALVHQHGLAPVVVGFLALKCAKYKLVCWRSACVNARVSGLVEEKLAEGDSASAAAGGSSSSSPPSPRAKLALASGAVACGGGRDDAKARAEFCAFCECPLWLCSADGEHQVRFEECGCVLHSTCVLDAARQQRGISVHQKMPSSFEELDEAFEAVAALLKRFFGVADVTVDSLRCPRCLCESKAWRRLPPALVEQTEAGGVEAVRKALRDGSVLRLEDLRAALLKASDTGVAEEQKEEEAEDEEEEEENAGDVGDQLLPWSSAAKSDEALKRQLRQAGSSAAAQLLRLLEAAAAGAAAAAGGSVVSVAALAGSLPPGACSPRGVEVAVQRAARPESPAAVAAAATSPAASPAALAQHASFLWG